MTTLEIIGYCVVAMVPLGCLVIAFIVALGKRKGLRRRRNLGPEDGVERRCPNRKACNDKFFCDALPKECPAKKQPEVKVVHQRDDRVE